MKRSVAEPRYAWGGETHHSVGKISEVSSDGLLMIDITGRPILWQADPADMEKVEGFKVVWLWIQTLLGCFSYKLDGKRGKMKLMPVTYQVKKIHTRVSETLVGF